MSQTTVLPACIMTQCQCQQSEVCPSCSASTVQASVVTAIVIALLEAVIFLVVMIVICKFHPKYRSGGAGGEGQVYEEVGGDEGGVAALGGKGVSDPTYMEVGEGGGKTFQLKENEAYGTRR